MWEAREKVGGGFHFVGRSVRARVSWELSSARRARAPKTKTSRISKTCCALVTQDFMVERNLANADC